MPTVDELLQWHKESRMSEIMAADTMDDAFSLFAEVNGLDQDDWTLRLIWKTGASYMAIKAAKLIKKGPARSAFLEAAANEMLNIYRSSGGAPAIGSR